VVATPEPFGDASDAPSGDASDAPSRGAPDASSGSASDAPSGSASDAPSGGASLALVPARGGSRRIPRKNVRPFRGVPLLARTVSTLLGAGLFDRVVVSTDDDEIAAVAADAGAEVPFLRPAELAGDHTGTREVVVHAIEALEAADGPVLGEVCVVYPAAVFTTADDLRTSLERLRASDDEFVMSASTFPAPIQRALRRAEDGRIEMLWPEHASTRSQDLEECYHDAGQFYWGRRDAWLGAGSVLTARTLLHVLPRWRVQDIDTPEDWTRAELLHEVLERSGSRD
jgi:pseudaminic acid cytidylyltransferase